MEDFGKVNEVYIKYFDKERKPARTCGMLIYFVNYLIKYLNRFKTLKIFYKF